MPEIVQLGGSQLALYLADDEFEMSDGTRVVVNKSDVPTATAGMADVVARHKARYGLVSLFCRPGRMLLDFPCGSGYAAPMLQGFGVDYEGLDIDAYTIEYARRQYGNRSIAFSTDDVRSPELSVSRYDVIACIEGLEHIERRWQNPLIRSLYTALKPGGTLVVSSPEAIEKSGPSATNPEHLWELTDRDFRILLTTEFGKTNVEIVSQRNIILTTGVKTTCLYGVAHRPQP